MSLKTYDGWTAVTSDDGRKAVLAKFMRDDGTEVHYNYAALHKIKSKPSESFTKKDIGLISKAISEGPKFFVAYIGWHDFGRGEKTTMICSFARSSGKRAKYNLTALANMAANPPKKFSPYDKAILNIAIEAAPFPK